MELAKGGELFDKLLEEGCLSERVAAKIITQVSRATSIIVMNVETPNLQVLEAVHDLHSRRIVHRDLKPENILFYDNTHSSKVLVVDFGLSEYEEELNKESPVCGTATYLAPEVIIRNLISRVYKQSFFRSSPRQSPAGLRISGLLE